jgi:F-type H+-transporting ATPase subunit b
MKIDWITVIAQVFNFLILMWLMKRFLFKPIVNAIDAREKRIATELSDANDKKAEAEKERDEFRRKNEAFDQERTMLMSKAKGEAKSEHERLLKEARNAAAALNLKYQETLKTEAQSLNDAIGQMARQEVFAIARKTLKDLAGSSLEESMVFLFISRLSDLKAEEKERLASAIREASDPAIVRSAFDLPQVLQNSIEKVVREQIFAEAGIRFETEPDLVSGIELIANGQKVAWSISNYLSSLENGVNELLEQQRKSAPGSKPEIKQDKE